MVNTLLLVVNFGCPVMVAGVGFEEWRGVVLLYIPNDIAILTDEGCPVYIQGE